MIVLVGDAEDSTGPDSVLWTRKATELLIDLYEEHEEQFEDPRKKKKDLWKLITVKMTEAGYRYSQSKIENKWRSLMALHKDLRLNKRKTGQKRRTFQYFEKMENILSKRHDIIPPFTSGSDLKSTKTFQFKTKLDGNKQSCTKSAPPTSDGSCLSTTESTDVNNNEESVSEGPENSLNKSTSAQRRREKRKLRNESACNSGTKMMIEFFEELEKKKKDQHEERERKRDERAKEKNNLLREFLEVLQNKKN